MNNLIKQLTIIIILIATSYGLKADTWGTPETKFYFSEDSTHILKVIPRHTPLNFYKWLTAKPNRKERFNKKDTVVTPCYAILYRINEDKDTVEIWKKNLINSISPVEALVSNNGKRIITIDNWHSVGYGIDVFVVYNEKGELIKRYKLDDFTLFPINNYMFSISSIWWDCGIELLNKVNKVKICMRTEDGKVGTKFYSLQSYEFENTP